MPKISKAIIESAKRALARKDYSEYCKYVNGPTWILGKHLKLVCSEIEKLINREIPEQILIVSMPPQHGKSQCVTETLPSWFLGKYPDKRVILCSYGDDLAARFGRRNKSKIDTYGRELFGVALNKNKRGDTEFEIEGHSGVCIARGIMAGLTGQPADLIILDDVVKNRQEADSETSRDRIWAEYLDSINTRLSAKGVMIVIMTRWHEDDIAGRLLKYMPEKCKEINIPLEAEENDILGREPGEPLFPEIGKNKAWLENFKKFYLTKEGKRTWNALMQGRPTAAEGNLFKKEFFRYYTPEELPKKFDQVLQSWDCTFQNESEQDDYVVGTVWGRKGPNKYLLDMVRKRMDFSETIEAILLMSRKYPEAYTKLIEKKANGYAIIQVLSKRVPGIVPIVPKESKFSRANSVQPQFECGNVYLPKYAPWVYDVENELLSFPNGVHDDIVDSISQALSKMLYEYTIPEIDKKKELPYALRSESDYDYNNEGGYLPW